MRVLLVEDDKYIAKATAEILKKNKYTVDMAYHGEDGLDCALSDIYDIIILDIMGCAHKNVVDKRCYNIRDQAA
jgi:DNA-binding response OmpR family regulator